MSTHENLVEELARLSPDELEKVLTALKKRLEHENQLNLADNIIKKHKPALKELAE